MELHGVNQHIYAIILNFRDGVMESRLELASPPLASFPEPAGTDRASVTIPAATSCGLVGGRSTVGAEMSRTRSTRLYTPTTISLPR